MRISPIAKTCGLIAACAALAAPAPAAENPAPGGLGYGTSGPDSLTVREAAMLHGTVRISGVLSAAGPGETVAVQRRLRDGSWETVATAVADEAGAFSTRWRADHIGRTTLRATRPGQAQLAAVAASAQAVARMTVYRPGVATYYGPGFFGKRTACGGTLTKRTLGVAHRTLPCGTLVDLYYRGRTVTVPVIDRGPFRKGTTWDLTTATADALQMTSTARIGAVRSDRG